MHFCDVVDNRLIHYMQLKLKEEKQNQQTKMKKREERIHKNFFIQFKLIFIVSTFILHVCAYKFN